MFTDQDIDTLLNKTSQPFRILRIVLEFVEPDAFRPGSYNVWLSHPFAASLSSEEDAAKTLFSNAIITSNLCGSF